MFIMQATDDVGWVPQWLINYSDSLALILSSIISNIFLLIMQIFPIFFFLAKNLAFLNSGSLAKVPHFWKQGDRSRKRKKYPRFEEKNLNNGSDLGSAPVVAQWLKYRPVSLTTGRSWVRIRPDVGLFLSPVLSVLYHVCLASAPHLLMRNS